MDESSRAADQHADYRFLRFLWLGSVRLVIACLFLVLWNLAFFRDRETLIFLGSTAGLFLVVSLASGMAAYMLYKRRGGRIEKTPPPVLLQD